MLLAISVHCKRLTRSRLTVSDYRGVEAVDDGESKRFDISENVGLSGVLVPDTVEYVRPFIITISEYVATIFESVFVG